MHWSGSWRVLPAASALQANQFLSGGAMSAIGAAAILPHSTR